MSDSFKVVHITKNTISDPDYGFLWRYVEDDEDTFIIDTETKEFWIASEFFYTYDIKSFIRMD